MATTLEILKRAKEASSEIALLSTKTKNLALIAMADALENASVEIIAANTIDVENSKGTLSDVMIDRLVLTEDRIKGMAKGIRDVVSLPDPIGNILSQSILPNGLSIEKVSVPLGVIGIIYESRPNVTSDAAALCFKSGNACVLKCGKEAHKTSVAIINVLRKAIAPFCTPDAINILEDNSRAAAAELMTAVDYVDALIPRGGAGLIRSCVENAKTQRPSVCNAAEVCLIHKDIAEEILPQLHNLLCVSRAERGVKPVELRLDQFAASIIEGTPASEEDYDTEFLDYILAIKIVDSLTEAIKHISKHSTQHSEAIISEDVNSAERFLNEIDSTSVYWNASTRFTDGGEFGLGCEIGISTQKLHARGPMGLCELTSYKYKIRGNGQTR